MRVVIFAGGRGGGPLINRLARQPGISLTLALNGYDDGLSTGEVRRQMGDMLGPSDFRKNASRLAALLGTCPRPLADYFESRLPASATSFTIPSWVPESVAERLSMFLVSMTGRRFDYGDASIGNMVFVGCYQHCRRHFNSALDDYCALLGLPAGLIENVTEGENLQLVGLDNHGEPLFSEWEIVNAGARGVRNIYLVPYDQPYQDYLGSDVPYLFTAHEEYPQVNPRLRDKLLRADVVIYAPGTQHSSLYPSYLTSGVGMAIADNPHAIKLFLGNIRHDDDILGMSSAMLAARAVYYLSCRAALPAGSLITDCFLSVGGETSLPLGIYEHHLPVRTLYLDDYEDPERPGTHDAARVINNLHAVYPDRSLPL